MNVRMIITRAGWRHKLHVRTTPSGGLIASLTDKGGKPLGVFIAESRASLDNFCLRAPKVYELLCAMHESNTAAAATRGGAPEVSLNHSAEFTAG